MLRPASKEQPGPTSRVLKKAWPKRGKAAPLKCIVGVDMSEDARKMD